MCYMAIRLLEIHRVLRDTGSVYPHCDPTMSHYLKLLLDCVFGEKQFRNEIVWGYKWGGHNTKRMFARKHDIILFYSRSDRYIFNYEDCKEYDSKSGWKNNDEGRLLKDWWWDIPSINTQAKERTGYPTQKPLPLLGRIIKASSCEGDRVLDPFCGCATTCVAAEQLGRQWVGIDVSVKAYELVQQRLRKEVANLEHIFDSRKGLHFSTDPPKRTDIGADDAEEKKYVYIMSNKAYPDEYKVGIAKDCHARLNSYQTSDPNRGYQLEYALLTPHYRKIESEIHRTFPSKHEWVSGRVEEIKSAMDALHRKESEQ